MLDEDDRIDNESPLQASRKMVKVVCPDCAHIQYVEWAALLADTDSSDLSVDRDEPINGIENDWWPGYIDEDDSD